MATCRRMHRLALSLVSALVLSAPLSAKARFAPSVGVSALYGCTDGQTIEVLYSGGDAAVVTIAGRVVQMARAAAPGGELYVGEGWQWQSASARQGSLTRVAGGASQVRCQAR